MPYRFIYILLFTILPCANVLFAQEPPFKLWDKNSPIQWSDFKGPVNESSTSEASINVGSSYRFRFTVKNGKRVFSFEVAAKMFVDKSWSKPDKQTPDLLLFEQNYFNITEYFTRLLKRELEAGTYSENFQEEIKTIFETNREQAKAMKNRYFIAIGFADDIGLTQKWKDYIDDLLAHNYSLEVAKKLEPTLALQSTPVRKLWNSDRLLTWEDFTGDIDNTSSFDASTFSGTLLTGKVNDVDGKYKITFSTAAGFKYSKSWTKPSLQSQQLLLHEQMHFNISELCSRWLLKSLNSNTYTANFQEEISQLRKLNNDYRKLLQEKYDEQTDHNKNKVMQLKWEKYLTQLLSTDTPIAEAFKNTPGGPITF